MIFPAYSCHIVECAAICTFHMLTDWRIVMMAMINTSSKTTSKLRSLMTRGPCWVSQAWPAYFGQSRVSFWHLCPTLSPHAIWASNSRYPGKFSATCAICQAAYYSDNLVFSFHSRWGTTCNLPPNSNCPSFQLDSSIHKLVCICLKQIQITSHWCIYHFMVVNPACILWATSLSLLIQCKQMFL